MNQSRKPAPPKTGVPQRHLTLALEDERSFKERGYDPYATVVHVKDSRAQDVWRHKSKRA